MFPISLSFDIFQGLFFLKERLGISTLASNARPWILSLVSSTENKSKNFKKKNEKGERKKGMKEGGKQRGRGRGSILEVRTSGFPVHGSALHLRQCGKVDMYISKASYDHHSHHRARGFPSLFLTSNHPTTSHGLKRQHILSRCCSGLNMLHLRCVFSFSRCLRDSAQL